MARRNRTDAEVSLFPFLSVLACVIGVLTLMITALALAQMDKPDGQAIERYDEQQKLLEKIKTEKEKLLDLQMLIAKANAVREELKLAREELAKLKTDKQMRTDQVTNQEKLKTERLRLLAEANRLRKRIEDLTPDLAALLEELKALRAQLVKRKKPPPEAVVKIQPGGSGLNLKPTFIECTRTGVVIYDGKKIDRIRRADLPKDEKYLAVLDRVAKQPKGTVVFLMRSDAIGTYWTARNVARSRYCRNGKLAVVGNGKLDLTLFEKVINQK